MFKRIGSIVLVLTLLASCAVAEGLSIALTAPEGLREVEKVYETQDGMRRVDVLTLDCAEYGMCNEGTLEELCELRANCPETFDLTVLSEEPFESYPARRVAYAYTVEGGIEMKAQAMAVWTDAATFVVFVPGDEEAFAEAVFAGMTFSED